MNRQEVHKTLALPVLTGPALCSMIRVHFFQVGKFQPFLRMIALNASISRLRSATSCFNRRFSSFVYRKRCDAVMDAPPNFDFQL
jgi:hypothetical protein